MRALMYQGPRQMPMVEIPEPQPKDNEVKIAVKYTGICGSDIHGYTGESGRKIPPMIMGHELSGRVASVGKDVTGFAPGDRVTVQPVKFCGHCQYCLAGFHNVCANREGLGVLDINGSFTEYICMPQQNVYKLPDSISDEEAALIEPLAVSYRAVQHVMPVQGKTILIAGAGVIGLMILKLVKHFGAGKTIVTDLSDHRLSLAKGFGADIVVNPASADMHQVVKDEGLENRIDIAIECVGASATAQQTIEFVKIKGTVLWVGNAAKMITINMQQVVTREVDIKSTYAFSLEDFAAALELLAQRKVDMGSLVTKIVPLGEGTAECERLSRGAGEDIKVLVDSTR